MDLALLCSFSRMAEALGLVKKGKDPPAVSDGIVTEVGAAVLHPARSMVIVAHAW